MTVPLVAVERAICLEAARVDTMRSAKLDHQRFELERVADDAMHHELVRGWIGSDFFVRGVVVIL